MTEVKNSQNTGRNITIIVALIFGILATILVIQNSQETTIRLWFWQIRSSLILILGITLGMGLLISYLLMISRVRRLKKENRKLKKQVNKQQGASHGKEPPRGTQ